jgi:hypothetical protein
MKICYLIHTFHHGGAEKLVYTLATRLAHRHDILVGALYEPRDRVQARAIMTELEEKGCEPSRWESCPAECVLKQYIASYVFCVLKGLTSCIPIPF